ncbi:MAG TPA: CDP-alcohol phosphatidyltransferase family protein [Pseudolabrys sp.]|nr:CDP-alcohol phosphatidyltransferase family protein [Pseudolabrys sp.]
MTRIRAFAVHIFTACGAALALLALIFATGGHWAAMFLCLGVALIVDGVDGLLAREFDVQNALPRWSGETLDYVVDFTTYVFVPAYAIAASGLLPQELAVASGVLIAIVGALYFADREMKTEDNYFRGFPALWNLAAFYLYVMQPPDWLSAVIIVMLAILTFVPVRFVHPLRVARMRVLNVALLVAWGLLALDAVIANLEPGAWVKVALGALAVYFCGFGLLPLREK